MHLKNICYWGVAALGKWATSLHIGLFEGLVHISGYDQMSFISRPFDSHGVTEAIFSVLLNKAPGFLSSLLGYCWRSK